MFSNDLTGLMNANSHWWWSSAKGDVRPPPDSWRSVMWFAPCATGRWRAFFLNRMDNLEVSLCYRLSSLLKARSRDNAQGRAGTHTGRRDGWGV